MLLCAFFLWSLPYFTIYVCWILVDSVAFVQSWFGVSKARATRLPQYVRFLFSLFGRAGWREADNFLWLLLVGIRITSLSCLFLFLFDFLNWFRFFSKWISNVRSSKFNALLTEPRWRDLKRHVSYNLMELEKNCRKEWVRLPDPRLV